MRETKHQSYKTLARPSQEVRFTDKKSKFYGYAFPIDTVEDVMPHMEALRKEHPKANHVRYAWQFGAENIHYRKNAAGKPRNLAATPLYGQILSLEITNEW